MITINFKNYDASIEVDDLLQMGPDMFATFLKILKHTNESKGSNEAMMGGAMDGNIIGFSMESGDMNLEDLFNDLSGANTQDLTEDKDGDIPFGDKRCDIGGEDLFSHSNLEYQKAKKALEKHVKKLGYKSLDDFIQDVIDCLE